MRRLFWGEERVLEFLECGGLGLHLLGLCDFDHLDHPVRGAGRRTDPLSVWSDRSLGRTLRASTRSDGSTVDSVDSRPIDRPI